MCETICRTAKAPRIRVISASIQDNNVHAVMGRFHFGQYTPHIHTFVLYVLFFLNVSTYWYQVIIAFYLHAVPCIIKKTYATTRNTTPKGLNSFFHFYLALIGMQRYLKAQGF